MTVVCLQAGHQHVQSNCQLAMRGSTGTRDEITWTPMIRTKIAALLRAHKFTVVEVDANLNCGTSHPRYDLTLALHYQSNTGHSGFGVFVPDPSVDRDIATSIKRAKAIAQVYAARTKLPNYSSPRLGLNKATWENPNTLLYYAWRTQNGPLALIECGEAGHNAAGVLGPDRKLLYEHPDLIASAIAEGVCAAFGVVFVDPAVVAAQQAAAEAAAKAKAAAEEAAKIQATAAAQQAAADAAAQAEHDAAVAAHAAAAEAAARPPINKKGWQDVLIDLLSMLLGR